MDYKIEESEDDENTVILHAHLGFLTPELTEKLRRRLIFVNATSESIEDDHSVMYFLHYLEPGEDTLLDRPAEPISTPETDHRLPVRYRHSISDEELQQIEEQLEDSTLDLFQTLVDNALNKDEFYEILNQERVGTDWNRVTKALQDVGGCRIMDIRKSEMAWKHAESENQQC